MRANGLEVDDIPQFLSKGKSIHGIKVNKNLILSYELKGRTSYLKTRTPTQKELQECEVIQLTSRQPWDPEGVNWKEKQSRFEQYRTTNTATAQLGKSKKELSISPDVLTTRLGYPSREVT